MVLESSKGFLGKWVKILYFWNFLDETVRKLENNFCTVSYILLLKLENKMLGFCNWGNFKRDHKYFWMNMFFVNLDDCTSNVWKYKIASVMQTQTGSVYKAGSSVSHSKM